MRDTKSQAEPEPRRPAEPAAAADDGEAQGGAYDPDEERLVSERLQALGYLG